MILESRHGSSIIDPPLGAQDACPRAQDLKSRSLAQSRVFTPWPRMPRRCGQTSAKHTQSTLGSPGPFGTAEGHKNMRMTSEMSLEVNACPNRVRIACAKPSFTLPGPESPVGAVEPRQNTCNAHLALQGHLVLPRGPQKHDIDTGDVARGQHWPITCAHRVCKAKFPLLDPKCPVGAV